MTQDRDFKRLVRTRAARTGESYASARAALVRQRDRLPSAAGDEGAPSPAASHTPTSASTTAPNDYAAVAGMSDDAVRAQTGCTWETWIRALDLVDAHLWPHREIARYLGEKHQLPPWWRQMIAVGYERVRGLRERGQRREGHFTVSKTKTYPVAASTLYRAFREPRRRATWMPGVKVVVRSGTAGKVVRFAWSDGSTVEVRFTVKGTRSAPKTSVNVEHARIGEKEEAVRLRGWWGERLEALAGVVTPTRRLRS